MIYLRRISKGDLDRLFGFNVPLKCGHADSLFIRVTKAGQVYNPSNPVFYEGCELKGNEIIL